jgi:hypothetical protein
VKAQLQSALLVLPGLVLVLGIATAVYWPGLAGQFMLDDGANIVIPYIPRPDREALIYLLTHNGSGLLGRSVSILSFVVTGLQYDLDPWGYKFHNLMLHLLNGVLLFRLLLVLLPRLDARLSASRVLLVAAAGAALWLLHPLQVSTVLYAVQRMTQLAALFTLLALLAWLKARLDPDRGWRQLLFGWVLFPVCGVLAVLSKESGALLPFYLLLIEALALRPTRRELQTDRRSAALLMMFVVLPLVAGLLLAANLGTFADYTGRSFTLPERLLTQVHVLFFYIRLILLPRISQMSLFHDDYPIQSQLDIATLALLALLAGLVWLAWRLRSRAPLLAFGLGWFLVSHLLESTLIPLEMVFEHRNYLALAGLLLPVVHAMVSLPLSGALRLLAPMIIPVLVFMTATRTAEWGNHELFTRIASVEHPGSVRAQNNFVNLLAARGEYPAAVEELRKLSATRREAGVYLHLLLLQCGLGIQDEEALAGVTELLGAQRASVYTLNGLQSLVNNVVEARCQELTLQQVEALVLAALDYPVNADNTTIQSSLLRLRGILAFAQGRYARGYAWYMTAHELTDDTALLHELVKYQLTYKRIEDATETFVLVEQSNASRFGIDNWRVRQLRAELEQARGT